MEKDRKGATRHGQDGSGIGEEDTNMAYSDLQRAIVAGELARTGGNIPEAAANLRKRYASFAKLAVTTVRAMLEDPAFAQLVKERAAAAAATSAVVFSEFERARQREELAREIRRDGKAA
jgi:hypothetical protein